MPYPHVYSVDPRHRVTIPPIRRREFDDEYGEIVLTKSNHLQCIIGMSKQHWREAERIYKDTFLWREVYEPNAVVSRIHSGNGRILLPAHLRRDTGIVPGNDIAIYLYPEGMEFFDYNCDHRPKRTRNKFELNLVGLSDVPMLKVLI